jgi:hypothetical protein
MQDLTQFLFWFLGVPAGLIALAVAVSGLEWVALRMEHAATRCQERLALWRAQAAGRSLRQEDRKAFLQWLAAKTGTDQASSQVDNTLIEAQRQSQLIRALVEDELPKAVMRCVETHRVTARVSGAYHMSEIAYEPECYQLRAGVVWLLAHSVEFLESYPLRFDDARLLYNSIVLRRRALPTCRRCPFIQLAVDRAPALCPTAELVQLRGIENEPAS